MNWLRQVKISLFSLWKHFDTLDAFFPDNLFLSLRQFKDLPANLLIVLIITLKIWPNIGDNFRGFILLNQAYDAQNIEYFRYEVLQVEILLLIHEGLHHFFDAAFGYRFLLVDKAIEDFG